MSELRHHPFLDQWVITATHRQDRTFLPPDNYCPLCPTKPGGFPTEVPFESYDIVVFENKFPSLKTPPAVPEVPGSLLTPVRPSDGVCEVVCYTDNHHQTLATLPLTQVRKLTRVWRDRYVELCKRDEIDYVFIFENKGKEIGVTLSHPHGQIYAYPYIPPTPRVELQTEKRYHEETGRYVMGDVLAQEGIGATPGQEMPNGEHVIWQNERFVAMVPFFARYPYEVYVTSKKHLPSLAHMSPDELDDLGECIHVVARKYDKLFGFSMPYIMAMHQEPGVPGYEFNWFHVEFYPPYRTKDKLKYLAGSEAAAGAFINDTLPEVTAKTLREIVI